MALPGARGKAAAKPAIAATVVSRRQGLKVQHHGSGVRSVVFLDACSRNGTLLKTPISQCAEFLLSSSLGAIPVSIGNLNDVALSKTRYTTKTPRFHLSLRTPYLVYLGTNRSLRFRTALFRRKPCLCLGYLPLPPPPPLPPPLPPPSPPGDSWTPPPDAWKPDEAPVDPQDSMSAFQPGEGFAESAADIAGEAAESAAEIAGEAVAAAPDAAAATLHSAADLGLYPSHIFMQLIE